MEAFCPEKAPELYLFSTNEVQPHLEQEHKRFMPKRLFWSGVAAFKFGTVSSVEIHVALT